MSPTWVEVPPEGDDWIHEIKYDGYRAQLIIEDGRAQAFSKSGINWSTKFRSIVEAAPSVRAMSAIIDGEMIAPEAGGISKMSTFRKAVHSRPYSLALVAFDLLHLDGRDLRALPVLERREMLWELLRPAEGAIQFSQHVTGGGAAFFKAVDGLGQEGMVSKRPQSAYRSGPSTAWLKTKCYEFSELEVAAVLRERGKPPIAYMVDADRNYVGGAFISGLNRDMRERLWARVTAKAGPVPKGMKLKEGAEWLKPGLMATVRHLKGEEMLRHASLKSIRD